MAIQREKERDFIHCACAEGMTYLKACSAHRDIYASSTQVLCVSNRGPFTGRADPRDDQKAELPTPPQSVTQSGCTNHQCMPGKPSPPLFSGKDSERVHWNLKPSMRSPSVNIALCLSTVSPKIATRHSTATSERDLPLVYC